MSQNKVGIRYCKACRWMHRAAWMAQELLITFENELDQVSIGPGDTGEFCITVNENIIFSRKKEGRFPELKEVKSLTRDLIAPDKDLGHSSIK